MILDHHLIGQRYFFPTSRNVEHIYNVKTSDNLNLSCSYIERDESFPTIIFFHGNGETVSDYEEWFPEFLSSIDCNIFLAEYRGYAMSEGDPLLYSMLGDVESMVNTLNIEHNKLIFYGRSVGSIYALHGASAFPKATGLIIESGIANVLERVLLRVTPSELGATMEQMETEKNNYFNHEEKIKSFPGKKLILHTVNDQIVNVDHAKRLYEWASGPRELILFEQGGHNDIFYYNQTRYREALKKFMLT